MWATLAAMAMAAKELNTAEYAFAAIDEVDKLHFVLKVRGRCCVVMCAACGLGLAARSRALTTQL